MSGKMCKSCLLPAAVPKSELNSHSTCRLCREDSVSRRAAAEDHRRQYERDLEQALEDCRGQSEYDCLVNLSGGKDSCLLLRRAEERVRPERPRIHDGYEYPGCCLGKYSDGRSTGLMSRTSHIDHRQHSTRKMFRFLPANQESRGAVRTVCYICDSTLRKRSLVEAGNYGKEDSTGVGGLWPGDSPNPIAWSMSFRASCYAKRIGRHRNWPIRGFLGREELEFFLEPAEVPGRNRVSAIPGTFSCLEIQSGRCHEAGREAWPDQEQEECKSDSQQLSNQLVVDVL